jgi:hypothetical protein
MPPPPGASSLLTKIGIQTDRQAHRHTYRQADRHTDRQIDRETGRQTDKRQAERLTETPVRKKATEERQADRKDGQTNSEVQQCRRCTHC